MPDRRKSTTTCRACKRRVAGKWCRRRINEQMCDAGVDILPWGGEVEDAELLLTILDQIVKTVAGRNNVRCHVLGGKRCPDARKKPRFYRNSHELWADGRPLHKFAPQAHNQEAVLCALQKMRWRHEIDDPLPKAGDLDNPKRLQDTADDLNGVLKRKVIEFSTTDSGRKIRWDFLPPEE